MPYYGRGRYINGPRVSGLRLAARSASFLRSMAGRVQAYARYRSVKRVAGGMYGQPNMVMPGKFVNCSSTRERAVTFPMPNSVPGKYLDQLPAASTTDAAAVYTFGQVCPLATGTSDGNRVGLNVNIHEIHWTVELKNGIVGNTGTQYTQDETYKILFLCYKDGTSNADPGITAFINADVGGFYTPNSFVNMNNIDQYTVLGEKTVYVKSDISVINTQNAKRSFSGCMKFRVPIKQRYNANTNTSICLNPIFAYVLTDTAHTGTGGINSTVSMSVRTTYSDSV